MLAYLEAENAYAASRARAVATDCRTGSSRRSRRRIAGDRHLGARSRTDRGSTTRGRTRAGSTRCTAAAARGRGRRRRGAGPARRERRGRGSRLLLARRCSPSRPTTALLAYAVDTTGGERYTLRFRDLDDWPRPRRRGRRRDVRPRLGRRRAHVLLRPARRRDAAVAGVAPRARHRSRRRRRSCSRRTTTASTCRSTARAAAGSCSSTTASKTTSEVWFVPTDDADRRHPRSSRRARPDHEYTVEHHVDAHARRSVPHRHEQSTARRNFQLVAAPVVGSGRGSVGRARPAPRRRPPRGRRRVRGPLRAAPSAAKVSSRLARVTDGRRHATTRSSFPDPVYTVWVGAQRGVRDRRRCATATRRSSRPSPTSTTTWRRGHGDRREGAAGARRLRPRRTTRRRGCGSTRPDGARVPVSIVHRKDVALDGTAPALLYGYGVVRDLDRRDVPTRRGSRCSIAGSSTRSRTCGAAASSAAPWYEDGRLEHKHQHVHRLHRLCGSADRGRLHVTPAGSSRVVAARAVC